MLCVDTLNLHVIIRVRRVVALCLHSCHYSELDIGYVASTVDTAVPYGECCKMLSAMC